MVYVTVRVLPGLGLWIIWLLPDTDPYLDIIPAKLRHLIEHDLCHYVLYSVHKGGALDGGSQMLHVDF